MKAGWLVGGTLASWGIWDLWAIPKGHESASGAVYRYLTHRNFVVRWISRIFGFILSKHLLIPGVLPQLDPFKWLAGKLRRGAVR